ncbi:c-type cytochrome [Govanella unica]|uniref:Cytochrome c n=1 Tax=Govanella unica TaxID=2975056 RepID=A0A9X3TZW6_9PROT|nr:cytochrome c [Govania unica]MDA5195051.1 cytochrome c [Govania unica]
MRGRWILPALMMVAPLTVQAEPDGAALYKRCAACHLASGAGVPGSFPPLDAHVGAIGETPQGRDYLVMVISSGLSGKLMVEGKTYQSTMPAQGGFNSEDVAALLNHVLSTVVKPASTAAAFTGDEVTAIRDRHKGLKASDVMAIRPQSTGSDKAK